MNKYVERLSWDTNFFSLPIGRITTPVLDDDLVAVTLDQARQDGIRCLYFEADPNDLTTVTTVEKNNFHLVDVRVVLECPFKNHPSPFWSYPTPSELVVTPAVETDLQRLEDMRWKSGNSAALPSIVISNLMIKGYTDCGSKIPIMGLLMLCMWRAGKIVAAMRLA